jgi:hypothetical protein
MEIMKRFLFIISIVVVLAGCGSDDSSTPDTPTPVNPPVWNVELTMPKDAIQGKPDWNEVDFFNPAYDNNMTAVIYMQAEYSRYYSEGDRMAAIVDGEVREIAQIIHDNGTWSFMLMIPFDHNDNMVDILYYNAKENITIETKNAFSVTDDTVGSENEFVYEIVPTFLCTFTLDPANSFHYSSGDQLALFNGDVCCGVGEYIPSSGKWLVSAYDLTDNLGKVQLRYYSAEQKAIYTLDNVIDFKTAEKEPIVRVIRF